MPRRIDKIREAGNDELLVQERELTEQIAYQWQMFVPARGR